MKKPAWACPCPWVLPVAVLGMKGMDHSKSCQLLLPMSNEAPDSSQLESRKHPHFVNKQIQEEKTHAWSMQTHQMAERLSNSCFQAIGYVCLGMNKRIHYSRILHLLESNLFFKDAKVGEMAQWIKNTCYASMMIQVCTLTVHIKG